jgi:hypothetical protein
MEIAKDAGTALQASIMAPLPTLTQKVDMSTTGPPSVSPMATSSPTRQPPGQPIILVFVLLVFISGCSAYFLCRNIKLKSLKHVVVTLCAPNKYSPAVSVSPAASKLVATAPPKVLDSYETMDAASDDSKIEAAGVRVSSNICVGLNPNGYCLTVVNELKDNSVDRMAFCL